MFCTKCGTQNPEEASACANCGAELVRDLNIGPGMSTPEPPSQNKTSTLAILSLIFGIVGLCFFPLAIAGVIIGIIALSNIKKSQGAIAGKGLAIAGTIVSSVVIVLYIIWIIVVVAFMLPGADQIKSTARVLKCQNNLKGLYAGMTLYEGDYRSYPTGRGSEFWEALRTLPTPAKSEFKNEKDDLYVCPLTGHKPGPDVYDYLGPDFEVNDKLPDNTPIGADKPDNHKDGTIDILYFGGEIKKVSKDSEEWKKAQKVLK